MAYNQTSNGQSVRIGNWLEELKLKEETGVRFYPNPKTKDSSLLTRSRCITHTERTEPKDYSTISRDSMRDPRSYPSSAHLTSAGPRKKLLESMLRDEVESEMQQKADREYTESRRGEYRTTSSQWFKNEGFRPTLRENDPSVRVSTQNASYSTDTAITFYSHALKQPNERINFPATFVGSTNPFSRHNAFSADIVRDAYARKTETNERPTGVPTVRDLKALTTFRDKLLEAARSVVGTTRGAAMRYAFNSLLALNAEWVSLPTLRACLSAHFSGLSPTRDEERAMITTYDHQSDGMLCLTELLWFIRPNPKRRRAELITHFFSLMPNPQTMEEPEGEATVFIPTDAVRSRLEYSGLSSKSPSFQEVPVFLDSMGDSFTYQQFHDHIADISAEMEDDYAFEEYLRGVWEPILG